MKRIIFVLLSLLLAFSLCACGGETTVSDGESVATESSESAKTVELDIKAEADAIISKYSLSGGRRYTSTSQTSGEYLDEDLIRSYYGDAVKMPDFGSVDSYEVYIDESKPIKPCEFGIFKMKDGVDAEAFIALIKARINKKIENSKAYPSMDTEPLKTAVFTAEGGYVWYAAVKGGNADIDSTLKGKFE
jgi:hypothetical protein